MRHTVIAIAAIAASLLSSGAMAQAYAGAGAGPSKIDACEGASNCDDTGTAFKVYGGYKFASDFAGELGYYSFGKATIDLGSTVSAEAKVAGPAIGVAYLPQLNEDWGLSLRLGAVRLKTKLSVSSSFGSGESSDTKTAAYYGVGVNYGVAKGVKLELGADFSRAESDGDKADVRAITIGVRAEF
jgi:OOP family OmpA-OmpF porin